MSGLFSDKGKLGGAMYCICMCAVSKEKTVKKSNWRQLATFWRFYRGFLLVSTDDYCFRIKEYVHAGARPFI